VLSACGVAGQLTICSLTIDHFSVPRRQTQQSSIGNPTIVNFLGTAGLRADAARCGVWLRLRRDVIESSTSAPVVRAFSINQ
jgi:hypothetical protein